MQKLIVNVNKARLVSLSAKQKEPTEEQPNEVEGGNALTAAMNEANANGWYPIHEFAFQGFANKRKKNFKKMF